MANASIGIGVDGVAGFKRDMSAAKAAVKALDSEMKQNEAAFKAGGDAQEYMTNKAKLLRQAIAEQQKVVKSAEDAMSAMAKKGDTSSTAYQNMRKQVADAKTSLVEMEAQLNDTGDSMEDASEKTGGFGSSLGKLTAAGVAVAVIAGIAKAAKSAAEGIWNLGKSIASAAITAAQEVDDLQTEAIRYGMTVQSLQKWQLASKLMDADVDSIVKARSRILDDATKSTNGVVVLDADTTEYDVAVRNAGGELRDIQDIFWDTVEALGRMDNATKRDAKAMELFGRSYMEVKTLFEDGAREKWENIMDEAESNTDEEIRKLNDLNDEMDKLRYNVTVSKYAALSSIAPAFETGADAVNRFLERLNVFTRSETGQRFFEGLNAAVTTFFDNITDEDIDAFFTKLQDEIFPNIISWLDTLPGKVQGVMDSIGGLTGALEKASRILAWFEAFDVTDIDWWYGPETWWNYEQAEKIEEAEKKARQAAIDKYGNYTTRSDIAIKGLGYDGTGVINTAFLRDYGFTSDVEKNIDLMQAEDRDFFMYRMFGNANDRSAYVAIATEIAGYMADVPEAASSAIEAGIPDVTAASENLGAAVAPGLISGIAAGIGGAFTTNNNQTYTFNVSDNVDASALAAQIALQNQQTAAGYGG